MQIVTVTIDDGGATEVKVEGVAGPSCKSLTEGIEKALGKVTSDQKTPEFHHKATQKAQAGAGGA
jgi:hypothetical protein